MIDERCEGSRADWALVFVAYKPWLIFFVCLLSVFYFGYIYLILLLFSGTYCEISGFHGDKYEDGLSSGM